MPIVDGVISLDSFSGGSDDSKLTAAETEQRNNPNAKATIVYEPRRHVFSQMNRPVYTGKAFGPHYPTPVEQKRSGNPYNGDIKISGTGNWWKQGTGETHGVKLAGVFEGGGLGSFLWDSDGVLWTSIVYDLCTTNFEGVLGSKNRKFLYTMTTLLAGHCNINNAWGTSVHIGGSDGKVWTGARSNVDAPPGQCPPGNDTYHVWFDGCQKTHVGDGYITAQDRWGGIKVTGNAQGDGSSGLTFNGTLAEGKNANEPCRSLLLDQSGGQVKYRDIMLNHSAREAARISGGYAKLLGMESILANVQSPDIPLVIVTGSGKARVRDMEGNGSRWAGKKPIVKGAGVNYDDSCRWVA